MANINYTDIASRFSDESKGQAELERLLGRVPTTSESASLTAAYSNLKQKSTATGPSVSGKSIAKVTEIQNLTSNVTGYGAGTDIKQPSDYADAIQSVLSGFFGKEGDFKKGIQNVGQMAFNKLIEEGSDILKKQVELHNDLNSQIGISGELSKDFRNEIVQTLPNVVSMGYGFDDLKKTVIDMMGQTGRFALFNKQVMGDMAVTSRAFVGDLTEMGRVFRQFEMVGIGASDALEKINEAGTSSLTLGLQAKQVVSGIRENLSKLNEYGFQNGVQGMRAMVQKSIEFRMNMDSVYTIADKVFDPEGAIDMAANLQAIGGAIGDLNDPLKMMYMATNNVEGLQDALIGVAGSLATYNQEQGRFEITGVNLRKAKAMAKELGISYSELANGAISAAERSSAATDMLASGLKVSDKEKEFLTNISRMEGGRMSIDIPESVSSKFGGATRIALADITDEQKNLLLENQKAFEKMSPEDIAKGQYTETQKMSLNIDQITAMLKVQFAKYTNVGLEKVDKEIAKLNDYMEKGIKGEGGNKMSEEVERIKSKVQGEVDKKLKEQGVTNTSTPNTNGTTNTLNVNHTVKDSTVVMDYTKRTWNDYFGSLDPSQYTAPTDAALPK